MTQFDARMGFAPALLCIEEEPLKLTKPPIGFGYRGRTNDPFEVGDHNRVGMPTKTPGLMRVVQVSEADCVQGARAERFAAQTEFQDPTCSISEYRTRYDVGSAIHDELTFYKNGQPRTVFRGMHDEPENKTVTEIQMKIRAAEQRMLRSVLDNMSVSRPMPAPSGLSMLMGEQRRQEKQLRHAIGFGSGYEGYDLKDYTSSGDGWFDGPPPCPGWWEASKSKHEGHYRYWNGSGLWSVHVVSRDGNCSNLKPVYDAYDRSAKVKWRPFTPPWQSTKTMVMENGRPAIYVPTEQDPLCQERIKESFSSSSAHDRSVKLRMLTKQKCDAAAARLDAAINGKPIESTDFWAELDKAPYLGGSAFAKFKADPVATVKPQTPANPGLADVNAKLQELSGETLKFKRFKPQLTGDWSVDPTQL